MSDLVRQLRKRIWAIHLVGPETVAVDISHIVKEAADRIEELESYTKQLLAEKDLLREEYIARQEWAATQSIAVIDELKAENKRLQETLSNFLIFVGSASGEIKWRSVDKDNLEFTATVTGYQMDAIRKALEGE